jgi:hypothetical protein
MNTKDKERLYEIVKEMNAEGKDFYSCLTYEENELLNQRGLEYALYLMTDNDQIKDTGLYENEDMPYDLEHHGRNTELSDLLDGLQTHCRVLATYWVIKPDKAIVLEEMFSQGEYEIEDADVLCTLFVFDSYDEAEEIAKELNIGSWYFTDNLQVQYIVNLDDIENYIINEVETLTEKETILNLIEKLDNYDTVEYECMKERVMEDIETV